MPEAFVDVAETVWYNEDSASPLTVFKPAAFAPGEMLVVVHFGDVTGLSAPAGWTEEENPVSITLQYGKVYSHVYDGADPSTWDFTYGAGAATALCLLRITHADVTSPAVVVPVPTTSTSNAASMDSPSVNPSGNHDLLVCVLTTNGNNAAFSSVDPSGMTDLGQTQLLDLWEGIAAAKELLVAPGSTGVRTWTSISPTGRSAAALSIAVKDLGAFDPDPPRNPPPPLMPPWLLREVMANRLRTFQSHSARPWVQEVVAGAASNAQITLITANGTKTGMVLVAFHSNNFYTAAQLVSPGGTAGTWVLEATGDNGGSSAHMKCWTRPVTADGPQTVTAIPAVDEEHWLQLFVIGGADTTDPSDDATGGNGAASTSHVAPSANVLGNDRLLLCAAQGAGSIATYTPPVGMSEHSDLSTPGFGGAATASQVMAIITGATGTRTFTSSVSQAYATASIVVRPLQPTQPAAPPDYPHHVLTQLGGLY